MDVDHLADRIDAPALQQPVIEVGVVIARRVPDDGPVAYRLRALAGSHLFAEIIIYFDVVLKRLRFSGNGLVLKDAVQPRGRPGVRRNVRAVVVPLLEFALVLLVPDLAGLLQSVPVELAAGVLLEEGDRRLYLLDRVVLDLLFFPAERHVEDLRREADAPLLQHGRHDASVARHVGREHAAADLREVVLDGKSCLE